MCVSILTAIQATNVALLAVPTFELVQETFKKTREHLGEILSAYEFMDQESFKLSLHHQGGSSPIEQPEDRTFYVLIETSGSNKEHDDEVSRRLSVFPAVDIATTPETHGPS